MADLHVDFLGKRLAGPVVAASGTFGFGPEYAGIEDLRLLGGISGKGLTLNGQPGKIWATSKEGDGTTMFFVIRKYQETQDMNRQ